MGFTLIALAALVTLCVTWTSLTQKKLVKSVLQDFLKDVRELCWPAWLYVQRVWRWLGPRVTNKTTWMAVAANVTLYWPQISGDPAFQAFLSAHPSLYLAGAFVALMASRPHGTLRQLPPEPSPTGGYVNNAALA